MFLKIITSYYQKDIASYRYISPCQKRAQTYVCVKRTLIRPQCKYSHTFLTAVSYILFWEIPFE